MRPVDLWLSAKVGDTIAQREKGSETLSRYWFKARKFLAHKVLHTNDTPHAIALGAALAMVVTFLPLIGIQTVLAIGLAALLRANKAVCLPIVWITNPFTMVPIYAACFGLGRLILGSPSSPAEAVVLSELEAQQAASVLDPAFWKGLVYQCVGLGVELWVGCVIVGVVFGLASYFVARWGVISYRERRRRRILKRNLHRSRLRKGEVVRRREAV